MNNENNISKILNSNCFSSILFTIIINLFFIAKFTYYIASIFTTIRLILFFVIAYFLCNKYNKIARLNILIISSILLGLTIFYFYEPIILEKLDYNVSAEYVNSNVIDFHEAKSELDINLFTTDIGNKEIDYSNWGKYKLKSNGKIIRLNDVPMNNVGENVNLIKLIYTNNNALIKKFIIYKPRNYKVKFFKKNNDNIIYHDLINNLNITINTDNLKNNKFTFFSSPSNNSTNFSIYNEENINDYLLNFTENNNNNNNNPSMKSVLETNCGKLFIYDEETRKNYIHAILKLNASNDYIIISIPISSLPFNINTDIESLNQYFKEIIYEVK